MASFETRGNSIRVVVRVPASIAPSGKLTQTFDNTPRGRREAEAWAENAERKKELGALQGPGSRVTARELFDAFEVEAGKTDSAKWNLLRLRKWQKDPIAAKPISQIVTHDINEWVDRQLATPSARTGEPISAATVVRELNLMSSAFRWAVETRRWLTVNPCHGARRPVGHQKARKPQDASPDMIRAIRIATGFDADPQLRTKTARVGAAWLLALETGMRSGEILRVRPEHYWREQRTVHVAAEERGGRKGARSGRAQVDPSRNVPLTARAMELLDALLASMPADQEAKDGFAKPPYIVGLDDGQRDALWRKARDQAGLHEWTFHDSKHVACTKLSKFLDPFELSHAIGTKDIRLLRDTYYIADASRAAAKLPGRMAAF
jgi:integrase